MKTLRSARLLSSSRAPATQYSRSGELMASAHKGSSESSRTVSTSPVVSAVSTSLTEKEEGASTETGKRQWVSRTG